VQIAGIRSLRDINHCGDLAALKAPAMSFSNLRIEAGRNLLNRASFAIVLYASPKPIQHAQTL